MFGTTIARGLKRDQHFWKTIHVGAAQSPMLRPSSQCVCETVSLLYVDDARLASAFNIFTVTT